MSDWPKPPSWWEYRILLPILYILEALMLSNFVLSLIRTYVPIGAGLVLALLARNYGVVVDEETSTGLVAGLVGLLSAAWYVLARFLESKWAFLSVLLATPPRVSTPTYTQLPKEASK